MSVEFLMHTRVLRRKPFFHSLSVLTIMILVFIVQGLNWRSIITAIFLVVLVIIAINDWEHFRIPNIFAGIALVAAVVYRVILELDILSALTGCGAGVITLSCIGLLGKILFKKESMGAGDIKLAGVLGIFFGWQAVLIIIWLACLWGSIYGVVGICLGKITKESKIPFGFFLCWTAIIFYWVGIIFNLVLCRFE